MPGVEKELMLKEVQQKIEGCPYIFFAKFKGLRVNDFSQLRRSLEKISKSCFVAKNSLLRKALTSSGMSLINGLLEGSVVLITTEKDPQVVSKLLVDFAKDKESFQLAGASIEGRLSDSAFVKELAKLPSRIKLIAKTVGGMKAPITGFVLSLRGLLSSLLSVLDQVSKKRQG